MFPANMVWNTRIDNLPVHPNSNAYIKTISASTPIHLDFGTEVNMTSPNYFGMPFSVNTVAGNSSTVWKTITFDYGIPDESDCATGNLSRTIFSPCVISPVVPRTDAKIPVPQFLQVESNLVSAADGQDHHMFILDTDNCRIWEGKFFFCYFKSHHVNRIKIT